MDKAELLQKIKALAERGDRGEQTNAQELLQRLMEKYGITEADLDDQKVEIAWFRFKDRLQRRLLVQVIYMITKSREMYDKIGPRKRPHKVVGTYCTPAQKLEIQATFDFYNAAWEVEVDTFFNAFVQQNQLFDPDVESESDLSDEEAFKLSHLAMVIERKTMHKQLEGGSNLDGKNEG